MLSRRYLLARRIAGEVMHKFAGSAKKRKLAREQTRRMEEGGREPGEIEKKVPKGDPVAGGGRAHRDRAGRNTLHNPQ